MLAAFAALILILPADASAQGRFSFDAQGGIAVPAGDLADFTEVGPAFGGGIAYWFSPRLAVRADVDASLLKGKDAEGTGPEGPDATLLHYNAGLQFNLTNPETTPWSFGVNVGAGASTLDVDDVPMVLIDFSETYFALNGGLGIGDDVSDNFAICLDGQWYLSFTDEEDTAVFNDINSDVDPDGFGTASDIPLTLGIRIKTS
jgi:hypothetical protein